MAASDPLEIPRGIAADAVDDLYGGPLEEFTSARNALSKELRGEGSTEAADWVKKLEKPTAPAAAINQLARKQEKRLAALLEAGAELSRVQDALLKGKAGRDALRAAQDREREIVDALVGEAAGLSAAATERVRETLHAASGDERVRELVAAGRLPREQVAVGLGPLMGQAATPARSAKAKTASATKATASLRKKLDRARKQQGEQGQKLEAATGEAAEAGRELEKVERRAAKAARAVEAATSAKQEADARVAELEGELEGLEA